jgi:hypothetical protein
MEADPMFKGGKFEPIFFDFYRETESIGDVAGESTFWRIGCGANYPAVGVIE